MSRRRFEATDRLLPRVMWLLVCALACALRVAHAAESGGTTETAISAAVYSCPPAADRPQDEVWYLSTRGLSCEPGSFDPYVQQYRYQQGWIDSSVERFLHSPTHLTIIYVHGNRMTDENAVDRGWLVYQTLATSDAPPIRVLLWSWPSDPIRHRPLRDVRVKANRAETEAVYLARFLSRIPAEQTVSLVGYSYGSRVIAGAMHVLGGGTVNGYGLDAEITPTDHWLRATLIAPAIGQTAFASGNVYENAAGVVQQPQVLFNPCDPVLRRYRLIECNNQMAMGYAGIIGGMPVDQYNVGSYIGKSHDEQLYLRNSAIMGAVRPYLLWQDAAE